MKITWTKLTALLTLFFNEYLKKYLVSFTLRTIGVTGGLWASIVSFVLTRVFTYAKREAESAAAIKDQENIDRKLKEKYDEQLKNDTPEPDLIQSESDILSGGRRP